MAGEAAGKEDVAVVPLAIPLMAGPGAISVVILDAHLAADWRGRLILSAMVIVVALLVWMALRLAEPIGKALGITGLNIATRIMGLILAAIGIQFMAMGLVQLLSHSG